MTIGSVMAVNKSSAKRLNRAENASDVAPQKCVRIRFMFFRLAIGSFLFSSFAERADAVGQRSEVGKDVKGP